MPGSCVTRVRVPTMASKKSFALALFALFVAIDLVLVGMHVIHPEFPRLRPRWFLIDREGGIAEHFQYIKSLWIAVAFLGVAIARSERAFAVWAALFGYFMLDDSGEFHERLGLLIAELFRYPTVFGLRPRDLGELTLAAVFGTVLLSLLLTAYVRGSPTFRQASKATVAILGLFAFFSVGVDAMHIMWGPTLEFDFLILIEDGGEMVAMSAIAAYAWWLASNNVRIVGVPAREAAPHAGVGGTAPARARVSPGP